MFYRIEAIQISYLSVFSPFILQARIHHLGAIGYHRMGVVHTCVTKKAEASVYECFGLQIYGYGLPVYRLHRAGQNYGAIRFRMHFQYPAGLLQKNCH